MSGLITVKRTHEIHAGHRVVGHSGKCRYAHGHAYKVHFTCTAKELDSLGMVIDFSVIKEKLCMFLENVFDHKFLAWEKDEEIKKAVELMGDSLFSDSIVWLPFNPTAENIAKYLVEVIGPQQLEGTGVKLVECIVEETSKCSASYSIKG